jgi:hypothetical protein
LRHIGGFFGLEKKTCQGEHGRTSKRASGEYHPNALALNTGRACMMLILKTLAPRRVYVPHYICDAALVPFREQRVEMMFYGLDSLLLPECLPPLRKDEYLLYVNYFGLCEKQIETLSQKLGGQLLVDDTHAFFRGRREGLWSFTSARKYFGVPDGAYLYAPVPLRTHFQPFEDISLEHLKLRAEGRQEEAFLAYQQYEQTLDTRVAGMSRFTHDCLASLDYDWVAGQRCHNFQCLDKALASGNGLRQQVDFGLDANKTVPFCYPYLPRPVIPHEQLYKRRVYPPRLWADALRRELPMLENQLVEHLLPLPVDHRYNETDMKAVIDALGIVDEK